MCCAEIERSVWCDNKQATYKRGHRADNTKIIINNLLQTYLSRQAPGHRYAHTDTENPMNREFCNQRGGGS